MDLTKVMRRASNKMGQDPTHSDSWTSCQCASEGVGVPGDEAPALNSHVPGQRTCALITESSAISTGQQGRAEQRDALREDTAALLTDVTAVGERQTDTAWEQVDAAGTAL